MQAKHALATRLEEALPRLRRDFAVGQVQIYGSVARGQDTPESDVDLLIEFTDTPSLFDLARLQTELETLLGRRVDIATPAGMHPRILSAARRDAMAVGA